MIENVFSEEVDLMDKRCVLMNCKVGTLAPTLGELLKSEDEDVRKQASILINKFGFKEGDIFCIDCFWK